MHVRVTIRTQKYLQSLNQHFTRQEQNKLSLKSIYLQLLPDFNNYLTKGSSKKTCLEVALHLLLLHMEMTENVDSEPGTKTFDIPRNANFKRKCRTPAPRRSREAHM